MSVVLRRTLTDVSTTWAEELNFNRKPVKCSTRWGKYYGFPRCRGPGCHKRWPPFERHLRFYRKLDIVKKVKNWIFFNFEEFFFHLKKVKNTHFPSKWLDHLLNMTSFLVTIATIFHQTSAKMWLRDMRTATENSRPTLNTRRLIHFSSAGLQPSLISQSSRRKDQFIVVYFSL